MSMGISEWGLLFIGAAWFIQVFDMGNKKEARLNRQFVLLYGIGVAILLVEGMMRNDRITNLLNLLAFLGAAIVFLKMKK